MLVAAANASGDADAAESTTRSELIFTANEAKPVRSPQAAVTVTRPAFWPVATAVVPERPAMSGSLADQSASLVTSTVLPSDQWTTATYPWPTGVPPTVYSRRVSAGEISRETGARTGGASGGPAPASTRSPC